MALYHFTAKVVSFADGQSAVHRAAYHARTQLADARNDMLTRDYAHKGDLAWSGIFAPKDAPDWTRDRAQLWNRAEAAERQQANGQPARNLEIALPNELTREQQIRLLTDFVREQCARKGMIADANIHSDYDATGALRAGANPKEPRNDHAHILLTMRRLDGQSFAKTKTDARAWNSKEQLEAWREQWAKAGAKALRKAGFEQEAARFEIGHRTLDEQRRAALERGDLAWADHLDREPDMKQGAKIFQMEERGLKTERGDERRAIKARNAERQELRAEAKIIDLELERLKRQPQATPAPVPDRTQERRREQGRFETWANARRAALQSARHEAEGNQGRRHAAERLKLEQGQAETYGAQIEALQDEAAAIAGRSQAKGLRGLVRRATGRAARDRDRAEEIRASLASITQRKAEQVQALQARQRGEVATVAARQAERAAELETRIRHEQESREAGDWMPRREIDTGAEAANEHTTRAPPQAAESMPEAERTAEAERAAREDYPWRTTPEERKAGTEERRRESGDDGGRGRGRERTR